jgi:uncharacterized protein YecT (DUF1311 family)
MTKIIVFLVALLAAIGLGLFFIFGSFYKQEIKINSETNSIGISPSFDCAKAKSAAEKLICSDSQLATQDNELNEIYKSAQEKILDPSEFKSEAAAMRRREQSCFDKACLLNWYSSRINFYHNMLNSTSISEDCQHFLGEEPYDKERAAFLEKSIEQNCPLGTKPPWK